MSFIKFKETGRGFSPVVKIDKAGVIRLNRGCINRFDLNSFGGAFISYDADAKLLMLDLVKTSKESSGLIPLKKHPARVDIFCKRAFDYFGIPLTRTKEKLPICRAISGGPSLIIDCAKLLTDPNPEAAKL